jgi:accessory secretory protein Asp1
MKVEYFIVAWHDQLIDWSFDIPKIDFYDGSINMEILQKGGRRVGLVIDDYQPQLTSKLNRLNIYPDEIFSVYDYLQGCCDFFNKQVLNYQDFIWPSDALFDITPYRILVISHDKLFAKIIFDTTGKILRIEYINQNGECSSKLIIDSRGFVSSKESQKQIIYFDQAGHWRLIYNKQTDSVELNPAFSVARHCKYLHMKTLIEEVLQERLLSKLAQDDHLIITLDDNSPVSIEKYKKYHPIYVLNPNISHNRSLVRVKDGIIVTLKDSAFSALNERSNSNLKLFRLPPFPFQFNFGHSQRLKRQIIGIFAEGMDPEELQSMLALLYGQLITLPDKLGLVFITYTNEKKNLIDKLISNLADERHNEFQLFDKKSGEFSEKSDEKIEFTDEKPKLLINCHRLTSVEDAAKNLDKIRILINWNLPDDFIMTAAVSMGIPQLQNFASFTLHDHKNGLICKDYKQLLAGLSFYLDSLQNWNQSLVYNAQLLNKYSEDNIYDKWESILKGGF